MYWQLARKEFREIWWLGVAAFLFVGMAVWDGMGLTVDLARLRIVSMAELSPTYRHRVPFFNGDIYQFVIFGSWALAIGLGLWQTLGESFRGTWRFLLHRPLPRQAVILTKVMTGMVVLLVAIGLPILIYALWAAKPGTHASPFEWWMTARAWQLWAASSPLYLAAVLCGLRDARWYGSRFLPLVPFVCLPLLTFVNLPSVATATWALIALSDVLLLAAILFVTRERDFA